MGLTQEFEQKFWNQQILVVGTDEAGRGPMAGPLVVAAVVFPIGFDHPLIDDSKKLSAKKREAVVEIIKESALWYDFEIVDEETIDTLNIYRATQRAMGLLVERSIGSYALTDAMPLVDTDKPFDAIVKGDQRSLSIAAASILAKTERDAIMMQLDTLYPEYDFVHNKGYGTKKHKAAIAQYGRTKHHRKTFKFKDES